MASSAQSSALYDASRINLLLESELSAFRTDMRGEVLTREQELRGALLAWICYFLPEMCAAGFYERLVETIQVERAESPDYRWHQRVSLELAAFGLSRDVSWLMELIENLAYGGSALRIYVHLCLALAAPECYVDYLVPYAERNLALVHRGCQWSAALCMVSRGSREYKLELLKEWLGRYEINPSEREILWQLKDHGYVANEFYLPYFFSIQSYIIERLLSVDVNATSAPASELWVKPLSAAIRQHPLMGSHLEITDTLRDR